MVDRSTQTAQRTSDSWEAESLRIPRRVDGSGICREPTPCIISQMSPSKAPLTRPPAVCPQAFPVLLVSVQVYLCMDLVFIVEGPHCHLMPGFLGFSG